jgi:hypothetical protein
MDITVVYFIPSCILCTTDDDDPDIMKFSLRHPNYSFDGIAVAIINLVLIIPITLAFA